MHSVVNLEHFLSFENHKKLLKQDLKNPKEELNEMEEGNLPKKELEVLKMMKEFGIRMDAQSEKYKVF